MKTSLITTTINIPFLLKDYIFDAEKYNFNNLNIIVIGDKNTHLEAEKFCIELKKKYINLSYFNPEAQEKYIKKHPELEKFLPWNCVQRRNLGILMAYEQGSEVIITIDDDNYLAQENYFQGHNMVGKICEIKSLSSPSGWLNICHYLKEAQDRKFYPRGYSMMARAQEDNNIEEIPIKGRIIVNGGLWLGDPDIDAVTRLAAPINVISYKRNDNFVLAHNTWSPFNSQNTALYKDCIPAYFLCSNIGRFDDIFASYMVKKIADHLGDYISFGFPLVKQNRNHHDLWSDIDLERTGMQLTDIFCDWLKEISFTESNYLNCTGELVDNLKIKLDNSSLNYHHRAYLNHFLDGYKIWIKTLYRISLRI